MEKTRYYATRTETRATRVYVYASSIEEAEQLLAQDYDSHHEVEVKHDTWECELIASETEITKNV